MNDEGEASATASSMASSSAGASAARTPPPRDDGFPAASSVPFPFERPYDVQIALMDAILESLRGARDRDRGGEEGADVVARKGEGEPEWRRRAPVIVVESPTGTGKSLSLACASMAWLKHCETADVAALLPADAGAETNGGSSVEAAPAKSPSAPGHVAEKPKAYDWIDSWRPADQQPMVDVKPSNRRRSPTSHSEMALDDSQTTARVPTPSERRDEARNETRKFALENRAALDRELNGIRARLDRLTNVASFASDERTTSSAKDRGRERAMRENLVRSGVASALARERTAKRRLARVGRGGARSAGRTGDGRGKRRKVESAKRGEDEFLLDEYRSDGDRRTDDSTDSEDDDKAASNDLGLDDGPERANLSSKALLCGSNLDGSGHRNDPERNARLGHRGGDARDAGAGTDAGTESAVGGVAAGAGLRKVVYAARTHSQLSQFVGELRRTRWKDAKVVALGSRSLLCGNDDVLYSSRANRKGSRRSEAEITEMCLDMQKSGSKRADAKTDGKGGEGTLQKSPQKCGCPFLASSESVSTLALHSLARPSDIEDVARLGKASRSCAYYASREALAAAEVVVAPYNTLLSPQARRSVGLSLRNSLVVIDEAHNVPEALRSLSSCQLSLPVAQAALSQLLSYTQKYSGRLAGRNVFYLGQIRRVLSAMIKYLKRPSARGVENDSAEPRGGPVQTKEMMAAVDLMFTLRLDNVNLFSIVRYLEKSRLSQKLLGFVNRSDSTIESSPENGSNVGSGEKKEFSSKHVSSMSFLETFLTRLTGTSREGRVIVEWPSEEGKSPTFRFVQIHSASQLDNVLEEAHAVVLAGGTLRPFTHMAAELFGNDTEVMSAASSAEVELTAHDALPTKSSAPSSSRPPSTFLRKTPSLTTFTCGHVIPPKNALTACISFGPASRKLDFRHASRSSCDTIDELGRTIFNLCNIVPKGFVVFLPSYNYESLVFQRWRSTGMLSQIGKKKSVHREPKSSRDIEAALARYSNEASSTEAGALLFSVMGGKMSEGINFANDMARCVLVVGLPYPDITCPVLKEKMQSLDKEYSDGKGITGQTYYQNLCMRSVNQSIGRAIRHAHDYAAIVLADYRYVADPRIWRGLPQWLKRGCPAPSQSDAVFSKVMKEVRSFFLDR
ncbi:hypothetical protein ACHAWF_013582 [Thalassiosira exigua]